MRRLLENGANSSFVHQITDVDVPAEEIARDPFDIVATQGPAANPAIPKPAAIFGASRSNSQGWDITDPLVLASLDEARAAFAGPDRWSAAPMTRAAGAGDAKPVVNPANPASSSARCRRRPQHRSKPLSASRSRRSRPGRDAGRRAGREP